MGWKAKGTWHGYYSFDLVPDCEDLPARVGFWMQVEQSWLFGSLRGEVWDDPPHGTPDCGVVKGRVSRGGVFFRKWMPIFYVWSEGRPMPLAEKLLRDFGMSLDQPVPHPAILYIGVYDPATDELAGDWEIPADTIEVISKGQRLIFDMPACTGRWMARRQSAG
jgi:hypothetical protein